MVFSKRDPSYISHVNTCSYYRVGATQAISPTLIYVVTIVYERNKLYLSR